MSTTVERIVSGVFYSSFEHYSKEMQKSKDITVDSIEKFFVYLQRFFYQLTLNENTVKSIDSAINSSRVEDVIKTYFEYNEYEESIDVHVEMSKSIKSQFKVCFESDLYKEISSLPSLDRDNCLEYTIIPGIEFKDSGASFL